MPESAKKKSLVRTILLRMLFVAFAGVLVSLALFVGISYHRHNRELHRRTNEYQSTMRDRIRTDVKRALAVIEFHKKRSRMQLSHQMHQELMVLVDSVLSSLSEKQVSDWDSFAQALDLLTPNGRVAGRLYVLSDSSGAQLTALEGLDSILRTDTAELSRLPSIRTDTIPTPLVVSFPPVGHENQFRHFLCVSRRIDDYDLTIHMLEDLDRAEAGLRRELLLELGAMHGSGVSYLFGGRFDGLSLLGPEKGKNMMHVTDVNGNPVVRALIAAARQGGGFVEYTMPALTGMKPLRKISYAASVPEWNWYIGSGMYVNEMRAALDKKLGKLNRDLVGEMLLSIILIGPFLFLLTGGVAMYASGRLAGAIGTFADIFRDSSSRLRPMDVRRVPFKEFLPLAESVNGMVEERNRTDEALRESERRLKAVFNNTFQFTFMLRLDGTLLAANESACRSVDVVEKQWMGVPFQETPWWPRTTWVRDLLWEAVQQAATGEFVRYETPLRTTDSEEGIFDFSVKPVVDENDNKSFLLAEARDITQIKHAEQELRFRSDLDKLMTGIAIRFINLPTERIDELLYDVLKKIGEFTNVDRVALHLFSDDYLYSTPRIVWSHRRGSDDIQIAEPLPVYKVKPWIDELRKLNPVILTDARTIDKEEPRLLLERLGIGAVAAVPIAIHETLTGYIALSTSTGKKWECPPTLWPLLRMVGEIVANVLERQAMESALRESDQRFRQLAENVGEVFFLFERESESLLYMSPVATTIFGVPAASYYENPKLFFDRIHPDDRDHVLFAREDTRYERGLNEEFRILRDDGAIRWIRLRSFPVHSEQGVVYRLAGIAADITEYKKAREETQKQQQQLIQADKLASIGMMVSGVAHEINNPNNLIMLNADVMNALWPDMHRLLNENPSLHSESIAGLPGSRAVEKFESMIHGIGGGAERIKRIVQNLKDFARIDEGDVTTLIDPNEVVESAMSIIHNMLKNASNRLTVHKGEDVPRVCGNFQKLEQVAINLLTNACQALENPDQGITVRVFQDWEQKRVVIEVADEGTGIAPENRNRILDPFFTTKKGQGGTGLGLSVSYGIMREHHGEIEFAPNHPSGTIARMWLPIHTDDSESGGNNDNNA